MLAAVEVEVLERGDDLFGEAGEAVAELVVLREFGAVLA